MTSYKSYSTPLIKVIILIFLLSVQSLFAQSYRIAIIPFTISAKEDLSHIKNGIYDLLSARLSKKDTVDIIPREETEAALETVENIYGESLALIVGAKLKANYVVFGTLTVAGKFVSIGMKVMDISGGKPSRIFTEHLEGMDKVIPQINLIATDINKQAFYGETKKVEDSIQSQYVQTQPSIEEKNEIDTGSDSTQSIPYSNVFSEDFWGSETYNILINGIALGDVDNDGNIETIILTPKMVMMYRCKDKKLIKIKDIKKIKTGYPISIDVADINKNGTPEIFVTVLDFSQTRANSFVLEFNGKQFITIVRNIRYYLRAVALNDTTHVLFGQTGSRAFKGKIYEMKWNKKKYVTKKQIIPSRSINVSGLAYGDIMNKKKNTVVAYDSFDYIKVIDSSGKILWDSREAFGGNTLCYKLPTTEGPSTEKIDYLPMRIQIRDVNRDGSAEVIAVKNHAFARNLLGNIRHYKKSHIEILVWDGYGLASKWKSGIISNYIRDFAIGDFDNDGSDEFVAALVIKHGKSVFVKPISSIIAFDLK